MIILMNPKSAGGTAMKKWAKVAPILQSSLPSFSVYELDGKSSLVNMVETALSQGETNFVAAGGDGTVNALVNALLMNVAPDRIQKLRLGAIGLGSSNDFHKPLHQETTIEGIPWKIDFEHAHARDIGCLTFEENGKASKRYFLINASIGATARANWFFNHPDAILTYLKRVSTQAAILYTAAKTILFHHNVLVHLGHSNGGQLTANLSNLGIIKNPHFSGNLNYGDPILYDNGDFTVHLCHDMTRKNLVNLFSALEHGKFHTVPKRKSWETSSIKVDANNPFVVEFDGETVTTTSVEFNILPHYLQVCP